MNWYQLILININIFRYTKGWSIPCGVQSLWEGSEVRGGIKGKEGRPERLRSSQQEAEWSGCGRRESIGVFSYSYGMYNVAA